QEGWLPLSALCLSHSHSAADMDSLLPPSSSTAPVVSGVAGPPGGSVSSPGPKRSSTSGTGNTLKALDSDQSSNESDTEQRNKAMRGRMFVVSELVQSEKDYVKDLGVIVEGFMSRLEVRGIPESMRGKDKIVFGNVHQIYDWHR
ncbi:hypothetical protein CRUP_006104, partial [Coryphaenoides rupestris]